MARFELTIYGKNDEVIKKYETDHLLWGGVLKAAQLKDNIDDLPLEQNLDKICDLFKSLFVGLTDEEFQQVSYDDIFLTFKQIMSSVGSIKGTNKKN